MTEMNGYRYDRGQLLDTALDPITPERVRAAALTVAERRPEDADILLSMLGIGWPELTHGMFTEAWREGRAS